MMKLASSTCGARDCSAKRSLVLHEGEALVKFLENDAWVKNQFGACRLGNTLRTRRLQKVATHMLRQPEQSLPKQNGEWADLKAAYRLFGNPQVTFTAVAEQHWRQTRQTQPGRYLLISDTTDIDHFTHPATRGLGILGDGKGRGLQLHSCLVYDCANQQIAGIAGAKIQYRVKTRQHETRMQRLARVRESEVWGTVVDQVGSAPRGAQWIHVFDRGGDNFEAMGHLHLTGCDWIIRAAKLNRRVKLESGETVSLSKALESARVLGSYELQLRSRPGIKARTAKVEVSVVNVVLLQPRHRSRWVRQCGIHELALKVIVVQEVNPKKGATPIRWVLLTSLPVKTFDDAWQILEDYEKRWLIEEYHKVLKTGCSMEMHALRTAARLEALTGLISVLGLRLLQLKLVGRNQPDAKAASHVPSAWLRCLKLARPKLKITDMSVYAFFRELAKLGGFLGRKGDGEPGWQTTWHGLKKLQQMLEGIRLVHEI